MTPPDSGERPTHREWCALIVNPQAEKCDCKRKPDSGEREVCGFVTATGAYICTLPPGHTEWHKVEPNHSPRPASLISLPLSLAQRILAALEEAAPLVETENQELIALAAELRACAEGKS